MRRLASVRRALLGLLAATHEALHKGLDARGWLPRLDGFSVLRDLFRHILEVRLDRVETFLARPFPLVELGRDEDPRFGDGVPLLEPSAFLVVEASERS